MASEEPESTQPELAGSSVTGLVDPDASVASTPVKSPEPKKVREEAPEIEASGGLQTGITEDFAAMQLDSEPDKAKLTETDINSMPTLDLSGNEITPVELFADTGNPPDADGAQAEREKFGLATLGGKMKTWLFSKPMFEMLQFLIFDKSGKTETDMLPNMFLWPDELSKDCLLALREWKARGFSGPFPMKVPDAAEFSQHKNGALDLMCSVLRDLIPDAQGSIDKFNAMDERSTKIKDSIASIEQSKIDALTGSDDDKARAKHMINGWANANRQRMDDELAPLKTKMDESGTHVIHEVVRMLVHAFECGAVAQLGSDLDKSIEETFLDDLGKMLDSEMQDIMSSEKALQNIMADMADEKAAAEKADEKAAAEKADGPIISAAPPCTSFSAPKPAQDRLKWRFTPPVPDPGAIYIYYKYCFRYICSITFFLPWKDASASAPLTVAVAEPSSSAAGVDVVALNRASTLELEAQKLMHLNSDNAQKMLVRIDPLGFQNYRSSDIDRYLFDPNDPSGESGCGCWTCSDGGNRWCGWGGSWSQKPLHAVLQVPAKYLILIYWTLIVIEDTCIDIIHDKLVSALIKVAVALHKFSKQLKGPIEVAWISFDMIL